MKHYKQKFKIIWAPPRSKKTLGKHPCFLLRGRAASGYGLLAALLRAAVVAALPFFRTILTTAGTPPHPWRNNLYFTNANTIFCNMAFGF